MILTSLEGKVALITGSTRGLGRTTADRLARAGASIIITGREDLAVATAQAEVRSHGVETWGIPADLSRVGEAHRLATEALNEVKQIDILVNNAGLSVRSSFWE